MGRIKNKGIKCMLNLLLLILMINMVNASFYYEIGLHYKEGNLSIMDIGVVHSYEDLTNLNYYDSYNKSISYYLKMTDINNRDKIIQNFSIEDTITYEIFDDEKGTVEREIEEENSKLIKIYINFDDSYQEFTINSMETEDEILRQSLSKYAAIYSNKKVSEDSLGINKEEDLTKKNKFINYWWVLLLVILIAILIGIIVYFYLRRKRG